MLLDDINSQGDFKQQLIAALQDPDVVNFLHDYSDLGLVPDGLHHTLGPRHDQSSYGDHKHDTKDSSGVTQLIAANGTAVTWDGTTLSVPNTAAESQTWQALPLSNGWVNFGGGHAPASIEQHGPIVRIKGLIKSGTVTNGTVIAAIPVAAMPPENLIWPSTTNDVFCTIGLDVGLGGLICRVGVTATWLAINITYSVR